MDVSDFKYFFPFSIKTKIQSLLRLSGKSNPPQNNKQPTNWGSSRSLKEYSSGLLWFRPETCITFSHMPREGCNHQVTDYIRMVSLSLSFWPSWIVPASKKEKNKAVSNVPEKSFHLIKMMSFFFLTEFPTSYRTNKERFLGVISKKIPHTHIGNPALLSPVKKKLSISNSLKAVSEEV